jgi:Spy/CpxP family protein refolding chaperone
MQMVRQLDLTDAQREQLRTLMEEARKKGEPGEEGRAAEQKLHAAILADPPDLQAIEGLKTALNTAHASELDRRIEVMQKVAQILTPAQRQQALKLEAQRPPRGRGPGRH